MAKYFQRISVETSLPEVTGDNDEQYFVVSGDTMQIVYANSAAAVGNAYAQGALVGLSFNSLIADERGLWASSNVQSGESSVRLLHGVRIRRADGVEYLSECCVWPLHEPSGHLIRVRMERTPDQMIDGPALQSRIQELEQQLIEKNQTIEDMRKEWTAFTYAVSHDLRAPLRAVDGFSSALRSEIGTGLSESGAMYISRIREASTRMAAMIDGLLMISRAEQQRMSLGDVDLSSMALGIAAELRARDESRSVEFVIASNITAYGDPTMLRAVLENLLQNAWTFTATTPDAVIHFDARAADNGEVVYRVADNGAGFRSDYAGKLFTLFQRLHAQSQFPGIGVGLALVRLIVRRHGGQCWAEGEINKGASFYFSLHPGLVEHGGDPA